MKSAPRFPHRRRAVFCTSLKPCVTAFLEEIHEACKIDPWFLKRIKAIVDKEKTVREKGPPVDAEGWMSLKKMGFSDSRLAKLVGVEEKAITKARQKHNVRPVFKRIDTCAAEIPSATPYVFGL